MRKLTNEDIDKWLIKNNKSIQRIGNIYKAKQKSINHKTLWKCLKEHCNYEWESTLDCIKYCDTSCPKCSGNVKLTNEIVDEFLTKNNKLIKRLENIQTSKIKIKWQCLNIGCNNIWLTRPDIILNMGGNCPKCANNILYTNEIIDQKLIDNKRTIKRLDNYINIKSKISWQCLVKDCNYIWSTKPRNIIYNNTGCPKCSNHIKLTNKIIDQRLSDKNIKRLDNYINNFAKINWQCLSCNNIWETSSATIIYGDHGCPYCNKSGSSEKLISLYLDKNKINYINDYKIKNNYSKGGYFFIDFFLPELNLFIEYNGLQHYKPVSFGHKNLDDVNRSFEIQKKRDEYVRNYCINNSIELLEIDGRIYTKNKLTNLLNEKILRNK